MSLLINPYASPSFFSSPSVVGLGADEQELLDELVALWARKKPRNVLRGLYLDGKQQIKNLNIAVPDEIADSLQIVVGWPEKAVFGLSNLCMWDGVVTPTGDENPFGLDDLLSANRFDVEINETITSAMANSVAFLTVSAGNVSIGEPPVVIMPFSAEWASALWDRRTRSIKAGLTIGDIDYLGRPTSLSLFTRTATITCVGSRLGWMIEDRAEHGLNRVPMEPVPFRPTLDRPFGRSRISRQVMTIVDRAMRAALRMDISSELFTAPGLLLNGITQEQWAEIQKWTWKLGTVRGLTRDEDGETASVETIPQQSMDPFIGQLRELAEEFASATSMPLSALGVIQDNPSSADAIYAAKEDLVIEATNANRITGYALSRVFQDAVMMRDGLTEMPDELGGVAAKWRNPAMPSIVSQSDAMVKQISAIPGLASTDVAFEQLGYSAADIVRIRTQMRRAQAADGLTSLLAKPATSSTPDAEPSQSASPTEPAASTPLPDLEGAPGDRS
ncbi:phage portal protein [Propionibacterium freudenreichii]|uniref:phage portal protein n=1 Tax=Propionibacterium freudenreichii TaxID=1744 RepID=UPI00254DB24A|nr:phage portal protein [Propionibacterium freudenreichii]MDK9644769.1 phage portal protein [Propionibacterium freudenreichii]